MYWSRSGIRTERKRSDGLCRERQTHQFSMPNLTISSTFRLYGNNKIPYIFVLRTKIGATSSYSCSRDATTYKDQTAMSKYEKKNSLRIASATPEVKNVKKD